MQTRQYPESTRTYEVGEILRYHLRPEQQPEDPERVWQGRVTMILVNIYDRSQQRYYLVTSLEPGYHEEPELVYPTQVIDPSTHTTY